MKAKRTTMTAAFKARKTPAFQQAANYGRILIEEERSGTTVPGFYSTSLDPKARRIFWRRAAAVQEAYDNAPAGKEAIADAVWRKLQSFRPKLTSRELDELIPSKFRGDVVGVLDKRVMAIRSRERQAAEAADDARRLAAQSKRTRKGGAK